MTGLHPVISPRGVDTGFRASKEGKDAIALRIAIHDALKPQEGHDFQVLGHAPNGVHVEFRGVRYLIEPSRR